MKTEQESLEDVLKRIDELGKDIPSEKVRKERLVHPNRNSRSCDNYINQLVEEAAEKGLAEIFENSPWYSARYKAGLYLMVAEGYTFARRFDEGNELAMMLARGLKWKMHISEDPLELRRLKKDFDALYSFLSTKYIRGRVCEIMGYSKLRFLAMEHPIATKAAGITAAVGAVSGIVYGSIQYLVE